MVSKGEQNQETICTIAPCVVKCPSCQVELKVMLEVQEVKRYDEVIKEERGESGG